MLPGSACPPSWRWQCLAAVALALGKGVELEHDHGMVGQQRALDAPAQAAQRQSHHRRPQLFADSVVAPPWVERDADLKPLVTHLASRPREPEPILRRRLALSLPVGAF